MVFETPETMAVIFISLAIAGIFSDRLKISPMMLEIIAGVIIGDYGLAILSINNELIFLREIGILILLFIIGLEFNLDGVRSKLKNAIYIAVPSIIIGLASIFILMVFDWFSLFELIIIGLILSTTSVSLTFPLLKDKLSDSTNLYESMVIAGILKDISIVSIAGLLAGYHNDRGQLAQDILFDVLELIGFILFVFIVIKKRLGPRLRLSKINDVIDTEKKYYWSNKYLFGLLGAIILLGYFIGLEPVVATFFGGLLISNITKINKEDRKTINAIGWSVFIPIFFFVTGMQIDPRILIDSSNLFKLLIILAFAIFGTIALTIVGTKYTGATSIDSVIVGIGSNTVLNRLTNII